MLYSGRIIKGIGGYYYVQCGNVLIECRARGLFRKLNIKPLVGDIADVESPDGETGTVTKIHTRKNELIRPKVSNIDSLFILLSANHPRPDMLLCDKLLINSIMKKLEPVICVNKIDDRDECIFDEIKSSYKSFKTLFVSAKEGLGLNDIKDLIRGCTVALAGQSAVGKSSLINAIDANYEREIGEYSFALGRGKHRTKEVILLPYGGGYIADTPGFSTFDIYEIESSELSNYFVDLAKYIKDLIVDNSLIYFDPPFRPLSKTSSFTSYSQNPFGDLEQEKLAKFCHDISGEKRYIILSNSDPWNVDKSDMFFDELYSGGIRIIPLFGFLLTTIIALLSLAILSNIK